MTLNDLVNHVFEQVGIPEAEIRRGYASHREQEEQYYATVRRMGRAWNAPPREATLERNKIGTKNLNLPLLLATLMQQLRDKEVNPHNLQNVETFQRQMAQVTQLVTPVVLADALNRKYEGITQARMECEIEHASGTTKLSYEEALGRRIASIRKRKSTVETVSSYHSHATIADISIDKLKITANTRISYIPREDRAVRVALLAIHRGGILPSLVAADLIQEMGCDAYVIGVDAKRRTNRGAHSGRVVGIDLKIPDGYESSNYSTQVSNAYVFPATYEKPDVLMVVDPMLATGLSSKEAISGCLETLQLRSSDVYCTSFFAGGYRGMQTLVDAGFNVHIVSHDQLPLTKEDYIKPGLGDAGDKMSGIVMGQDVKDIYQLLKGMEHLIEAHALSMKRLELYARQMTGRRLQAA